MSGGETVEGAVSIDIEQLAKEWIKQSFPEGGDCCEIAFLAGYKAAKDEEVAKDQKIAELWTESIKNMLPSVHEITLFPSKLNEDK